MYINLNINGQRNRFEVDTTSFKTVSRDLKEFHYWSMILRNKRNVSYAEGLEAQKLGIDVFFNEHTATLMGDVYPEGYCTF